MAKTREIKTRMKAVGNIKRITKTMQMIATARFQAALKRAAASKPYSHKISEFVGELAGVGGSIDHPLLNQPEPAVGRKLLLVISSNRGLCGGYNANILRTASQFLKATETSQENPCEVDVQVVGKKGRAFFKFAGREVETFHSHFGDEPKYEDVQRLADTYMADFIAGKYDSVHVVYMDFETTSRQSPKVLNLLPLQPPTSDTPDASEASGDLDDQAKKGAEAQVEYDFSPEPEVLLGELLPATVKVQLFQCFNDAVVSEQVARMVAMKAATDAAGKMGKSLARQFNRARQTAITTELTEIIGGTAALE